MNRIEQMQKKAFLYAGDIDFSKNNTKIYSKQNLPEWDQPDDVTTHLCVIPYSVQEAIEYFNSTSLAVLSFAGRKSPAGTCRANQYGQEADLSAISFLPTVLSVGRVSLEFYMPNREALLFGSDAVVYSPRVPFILPSNNVRYIDIISCSSPRHQSTFGCSELRLRTLFEQRIDIILSSALSNGVKDIILGAWGCGGHAVNPELVANAFKAVITTAYNNVFENIVFAIPESSIDENYSVFRTILEEDL